MRSKEEVLDNAKKLKENQPIWVKKDPNIPLGIVAPNPVGISFHEPFGIYGKAKNPHAALLWIEFVASNEAQQIVETWDPGKCEEKLTGICKTADRTGGGRN